MPTTTTKASIKTKPIIIATTNAATTNINTWYF